MIDLHNPPLGVNNGRTAFGLLLILMVSCLFSQVGGKEKRAECVMWSYLENKTMPLQDQGHATCVTNEECTGFACEGVFKDAPVNFGMKVLNCQEPPGLELFGHAPQFHAYNFSHVFKHGSKYEVPGAMLTGQSLNNNSMTSGLGEIPAGIPGLNIYFVVSMEPNKENHSLTIGLEVQACMNVSGMAAEAIDAAESAAHSPGELCILRKPIFNNTDIPVPHCEATYAAQSLVDEPCNVNEIGGCGDHQTCRQTEPDSEMGKCECLTDFIKKPDRTCLQKDKLVVREPAHPEPHISDPTEGGESVTGGVLAALLVVAIVIVLLGLAVKRWRLLPRLRARLTNTPYEDIVIEDRGRV